MKRRFLRNGCGRFFMASACLSQLPVYSQDLLQCGSYEVRALHVAVRTSPRFGLECHEQQSARVVEGSSPHLGLQPCPGGRVLVASSARRRVSRSGWLLDPVALNVCSCRRNQRAFRELLRRTAWQWHWPPRPTETGWSFLIFRRACGTPLARRYGRARRVWDEPARYSGGLSDSFIAGSS